MTSTERVRNTILGKPIDRQPIYGWVYGNLTTEFDDYFGSLAAFEKRYESDAVRLFAGPQPVDDNELAALREQHGGELEPDVMLKCAHMTPVNDDKLYEQVRKDVKHYKELNDRFCYIQTPGILEQYNGCFGIENHLLYLAEYPDELMRIYERQADWTIQYARNCIECGVDMIHISDDWGAQKSLMISPKMWREMIYPHLKRVVDDVHAHGCLCSLHSDGCVASVLDGIVDLGLDLIHPYQENANMPYDLYLDNYADKFAIMGGINIQNALGIMNRKDLEADIRRVFKLLRNKRWVVCTTHFVQKHCTVEDLEFAYDLIYDLARA